MSWTTYQSPLGTLTLIGGDAGLRAVRFPGRVRGLGERDRDPAALTAVAEQLGEYFAGERETFDFEATGRAIDARCETGESRQLALL
jgi:methylated-DNA-[protein]-cysteine S-methyltransferase